MPAHLEPDEWGDDHSDLDALGYTAEDEPDDPDTDLDTLDYGPGPQPESEDTDLDALAAAPPDVDDDAVTPVASASNPANTITVTAYLTGVIARVDLDNRVTALPESQLAQQIQAVAEVAVKRASAVVHIAMVKVLMDTGMDFLQARDFAENMLPFTTPAQADAAAAELATRFADSDPGHA
jgi:hypothetical protein